MSYTCISVVPIEFNQCPTLLALTQYIIMPFNPISFLFHTNFLFNLNSNYSFVDFSEVVKSHSMLFSIKIFFYKHMIANKATLTPEMARNIDLA